MSTAYFRYSSVSGSGSEPFHSTTTPSFSNGSAGRSVKFITAAVATAATATIVISGCSSEGIQKVNRKVVRQATYEPLLRHGLRKRNVEKIKVPRVINQSPSLSKATKTVLIDHIDNESEATQMHVSNIEHVKSKLGVNTSLSFICLLLLTIIAFIPGVNFWLVLPPLLACLGVLFSTSIQTYQIEKEPHKVKLKNI